MARASLRQRLMRGGWRAAEPRRGAHRRRQAPRRQAPHRRLGGCGAEARRAQVPWRPRSRNAARAGAAAATAPALVLCALPGGAARTGPAPPPKTLKKETRKLSLTKIRARNPEITLDDFLFQHLQNKKMLIRKKTTPKAWHSFQVDWVPSVPCEAWRLLMPLKTFPLLVTNLVSRCSRSCKHLQGLGCCQGFYWTSFCWYLYSCTSNVVD